MSTILLGGSGFIGPQILAQYPDVISVGRTRPQTAKQHIDCKTVFDLEKALQNVTFDKVIMMIGSSNHHALNKENLLAVEKNVLPLKTVFRTLRNFDIKKLISFTTILLYDRTRMVLPVDESQSIDPYQNEYVFSKYLAEEVARFYEDVPNIIARMTNIYGPSTVLGRPDVVNQLVEGLILEKRAAILNTEAMRDFIYTKDAIDAIMKLLDSDYTGTVNLATGTMNSIGEIVQFLEQKSGIAIERLNGKASGHLKFVGDVTRLKRIIDWEPKYSLTQGLDETYDVMEEMYG